MACYGNIIYGPTADAAMLDPVSNVVLPTTGKPKLTLKPVYADDGVTIAYYGYNLTVDCQLSALTAVATDPASISVENEVTRIRNILATPGLKLVIYPVGLGSFPCVNGTVIPASSTRDLLGGPFPEDVSVSPILTNNMIGVSWSVRFGISHCPPTLVKSFVQFNTELDVTVDEEGWLEFSVNTHYQTVDPLSNLVSLRPLIDAIGIDVSKSFQGMHVKERTSQSRDKRMTHVTFTAKEIKSDSPYHPYVKNVEMTDTIQSSLFETDVTKGAGFQSWERTIEGAITLPRRVPKIWSWAVFASILKERFVGMSALNKIPSITAVNKPANQANAADAKTDRGSYLLTDIRMTNHLYSPKMEFSFTYLITMNLLDILKQGANFFFNVRSNVVEDPATGAITIKHKELPTRADNPDWPNNDKSVEWAIWSSANYRSPASIYGYNSNGPIVFAQCLVSPGIPIVPVTEKLVPSYLVANEKDPPYITPEPPPSEPPAPGSLGFGVPQMNEGITDSNSIDEITNIVRTKNEDLIQKSWIDYKNKVTIIENNNNSQAEYLQDNTLGYFQADAGASVTNEITNFTIDGKSASDPEIGKVLAETFVHGISSYKLRMTGYAIRVGYKIPVPAMISVNGVGVTRSGEARYEHETLVQGSTLGTASDPNDMNLPVYVCRWDITYNVDSNLKGLSTNDLLGRLMCSGDPSHYI